MGYIEEKIQTRASKEKVFNLWKEKYKTIGFEIGSIGRVGADQTHGIKVKILDIKANESFTIIWYSFFFKLFFLHKVEDFKNGSLITCQVRVKGFFAFFVKPLIYAKIKNSLKTSLKQFSLDLNKL
jgi:hypothetical protein